MIASLPPQSNRTIGFMTCKGRYVCRDPWCVKMIEAKGDTITRIVKNIMGGTTFCDFCHEILGLYH